MKLDKEYRTSYLGRLLSFLFSDKWSIKFSETFMGKLICNSKLKTNNPKLSHVSFFLSLTSVALLWYEAPLETLWSPLGNDFLPFLLLFASLLLIPKKDLIIRKYHLWYLGFLMTSLIAGIIGAALGYGGLEIFWGWAVYLQFGLVLLLGNLMTKEERITPAYLLLAMPMMVRGVWEIVVGEGGSRYSYLETAGVRVNSFFESPNIFGLILVILAISMWQLAISRKNNYLYGLLVPILGLLYLTGSRTAWLALLVAAVVIIVSKNWKFILATPLALMILVVPRVRERILVIFSSEYYFDASIDGRIWSIKNAIHIWSQNILGTGPGTYGGKIAEMKASPVYLQSMQNGYTALYTTDNQWLSILVQTGILGTLSFMGTLGTMTVRLLRNKKAFGLALLAAFMVMMTFSNALEFGTVVVPMGLLLGKELAE